MSRKAITKTPLGQRLSAVREALGYTSRAALAADLGMHAETLGGYERGDSTPDLGLFAEYSQRFSVNVNWLVNGSGEMFLERKEPTPEEMKERQRKLEALKGALTAYAGGGADDLSQVAIPRLNVRASAGVGETATDAADELGRFYLPRAYLRELGANPLYCRIVDARGDSMFPTIQDGAALVVDVSKTEVQDKGVYIFSVAGDIKVKRARMRVDGRLDLISDNDTGAYPPETYSASEAHEIISAGRVLAAINKL